MTTTVDQILNEVKGKKAIPNFVVLSFIISLLAIDFLPYFKSMEIINPQFLYLSIINLIIGIYFYFTPELISSQGFSLLKKSYITKFYLAFLFFCAISIFSATNISLVITRFSEILIIFCLFINLSILLADKKDLFYQIIFIVCISALFQSWIELHKFVILPKHASIIQLLNTMAGNTGNINILAASLTIKVPFLLLGITYFKHYKKWLLLFALLSVTAVILLTGARAAILNLFLIYLFYTIYLFREYSINRSTITKITLLIIPLLFAILFSNLIFKKSENKDRYVSVENRIGQINSEDASSQKRLGYWKNVFDMTQKKPLTGIGLGNYQLESIPYERATADDMNVSLHAHNDFLEILAETGILNGLIYFSLFVFIFLTNFKLALKADDKNRRTIAILTLLIIIVYGIDSLFNFPMYRPTMQIFFALMLALTVVNQKTSITKTKSKVLFPVLISTAIITTYCAFIIYKASNLEYLINTDDINVKQSGVLKGDDVVRLMPKFPNVFGTSESFYEYAGIYYVREKNYNKAFKCFSKADKINPYSGRVLYYKHLISIQKGNIDSAYIYSKKAFYLRPRNYHYYLTLINLSQKKRDTIEILKAYKTFSEFRKMPEALNLAGEALQSAGYDDKKLAGFINRDIKFFPNDSTILNKKNSLIITGYIVQGQKYEEKSKMDKALESYNEALKIDANNIYALQNIGFFYFNRGKNDLAIHYLEKALKRPGLTGGKTEFFLAVSYMNSKDKNRACKYFKLSNAQNYPQAKLFKDICNF